MYYVDVIHNGRNIELKRIEDKSKLHDGTVEDTVKWGPDKRTRVLFFYLNNAERFKTDILRSRSMTATVPRTVFT